MFTLIVDLSLEMKEVENIFKKEAMAVFEEVGTDVFAWSGHVVCGLCNVFESEELSQQVCIEASIHV